MSDFNYKHWEDDLKDLLSWFQKAVSEYEKDAVTRRNNMYSTGFMIPPTSTASTDNARMAILNHCKRLEERTRHGIL